MGSMGRKRQKNRRASHAEDIAEVRTRAHEQILHHVPEGFSAFDDAVVEDAQAGLDENHVGGITGHVGCTRYGNAHIGRVQRRRIVNTVAHEADGMPGVFESQENPVLLCRRNASEDVRFLGVMGQRRIRHIGHFVARDNVAGIETDLRTHAGGDKVVVAGDDLDLDAIAV